MNEFVCHTIDPPKIKFNPDPSNLRKKILILLGMLFCEVKLVYQWYRDVLETLCSEYTGIY
jgi:hypothetical protein